MKLSPSVLGYSFHNRDGKQLSGDVRCLKTAEGNILVSGCKNPGHLMLTCTKDKHHIEIDKEQAEKLITLLRHWIDYRAFPEGTPYPKWSTWPLRRMKQHPDDGMFHFRRLT